MADKTEPEATEQDPNFEPLTQPMVDEEVVAADGHVVYSKEDLKARKAAEKKA